MPQFSRRNKGWHHLEAAADAFYSVLERLGLATGVRNLPKSGSDEAGGPSHARRLISMGKRGQAVPEYRVGFGWHIIFLYIALPLVLALLLAPKQLLEQIPGVPRSYAPVAGGDVIVVSARESHRETVASTAQPRGYSVTAVESVKELRAAIAGSANLRFIVVDRDSAGTAVLRAAIQDKSPAPRIVLLPETATTAEIANQLIQAGLR